MIFTYIDNITRYFCAMLGSIFCSSALKMFTVNKWKLLFQKLLRKKGLNSYHFDCSNFNKANDDLSVPKKCPKFPIESIGCQMKKRREGQYDRKSTRSPKVIRIARGGSRTRYPRLCYLLLYQLCYQG